MTGKGAGPEYLVALNECRHTPTFQRNYLPRIGEVLWCVRCQRERTVRHVVGMYRGRCDRCRFSRWYGAAKLTAQRAADKHARTCPGHVVTVLLGDEFVSVHGRNRGIVDVPLPIGDDAPPF